MNFKLVRRRANARMQRILKRGDTFLEMKILRQDSFDLVDNACERQAVAFYNTQIDWKHPAVVIDLGDSVTSLTNYGIAKLELKWALETAGIPHTYENGKLSLVYTSMTSYLLDRQIQASEQGA